MSESTPWQPPVVNPEPSVPSSPYQQTAYGAQQPPTPGWAPPPKPGLIPLRPLTFGTLLGATFQVLRRNPKPTFGFSLLLMSAVGLLTMAVVGAVTAFATIRTLDAAPADQDVVAAGSVLLVILASLVPAGLSLVVAALVQGTVSLEVARGTLGEKHRLRGLLRAARGRILALIGWSALVLVALAASFGILALIVTAFALVGGMAGVFAAVVIALLLGAALAVLAAWIGTKLALVPSVLMIERATLLTAVKRSWSLTNGYFWKTFGIILLVAVIVQVVASIVTTPLSFVLSFGTFLIDPNGTEAGAIIFLVASLLLTVVVSTVIGAIALVVQSATPALIYIDLRMRKEGLDLELQRYVEARQAGNLGVANPYAQAHATTAPAGSAWA